MSRKASHDRRAIRLAPFSSSRNVVFFATVCSNSFVGPFVVWHQRTEGTGNNFTFHLAPGKGKLRGGGRLVVDEVKGLLQTRLR